MKEKYPVIELQKELDVKILEGKKEESYHWHNGYKLILMLKGKADFHIKQQVYSLVRGNLVFLRPEDIHQLRCQEEDQECVIISLSEGWLLEHSTNQTCLLDCFRRTEENRPDIIQLGEHQIGEFMSLTKHLMEDLAGQEFGDELLASCHATALVLMADRMAGKIRQRPENGMSLLVQQTVQYVQEHIHEQILVEDLAGTLYHNRSHISRMFRENMGISLQQYIINQRLAIAMQALQEGKSLTEASETAGFGNYANFIRTFSKHVGVSPGRYQRMMKEDTL